MSVNFKAEEQFIEADTLIKENRIEEAVNLLIEILSDDPSFGKAHNHLGWIYETKVKDYVKAEEHYKLAMKVAPAYTASYINYAYLLSSLKRQNDLEAHLKICEMVPGISRATLDNEWAIYYESKGMFDEAIAKYKDYIMQLYDNATIDVAMASIERCKKKKEIFRNL